MDNTVVVNRGRPLEVREYGDRRGHPAFFFHGLIGSHYQASYVAEQASRAGLRIIAPNRPGVGRSEFVRRKSPLEAVADVEELAEKLGLGTFSVIGISGGAPYALATLYRLGDRIRTTTLISGMGPAQLPGALHGMDPRRRIILAAGSRYPRLARMPSGSPVAASRATKRSSWSGWSRPGRPPTRKSSGAARSSTCFSRISHRSSPIRALPRAWRRN